MKPTVRVRLALATAAATTALAVASYGIVDSAGAQGQVRGVTATTIKVGGLGASALYGDAGTAAKARFDAANATGEIPGGRKIEYVGFADDQSDAAANDAAARALVEQQQVFAVVPVVTSAMLSAGEIFNRERVPAVGWGIAPGFCGGRNRYVLGFTGCRVPSAFADPTWAQLVDRLFVSQGQSGAKGKTAVVVAENDEAGKYGADVVAAGATFVGMNVVAQQPSLPVGAGAVDYAVIAQGIMTASGGAPPDAVFLVTGPTHVTGVGTALNRAGYKGVNTNASAYAPALARAVASWPTYTQFATPESGVPAMAEITATLKAAGIESPGQAALTGYLAADMFVQILGEVGRNLTPARFARVASRFTYEIDGVVGPTVYPAGFKAPTPCGQLAVSDTTKFTVIVPYACDGVLKRAGSRWVSVPYPKGVR